MDVYWLGVVIDRLPDSFEDGVVVYEGFSEKPPDDASQFRYAILARAMASSPLEAERLTLDATTQYLPSAAIVMANAPAQVIRNERRVAKSLQPGDVSLKNSFVAHKRDDRKAESAALDIINIAITKKWWQFWR